MEKMVVTLSNEEQTSIYGGDKKNYRWIHKEENNDPYNFDWKNN